jgi:hypothetical protein
MPHTELVTETTVRHVIGYHEVHVNLHSSAHAPAAPSFKAFGAKERDALAAARAKADGEVLAEFWAAEASMGFPVDEGTKQRMRETMALSGSVGCTGHAVSYGPAVAVRHPVADPTPTSRKPAAPAAARK